MMPSIPTGWLTAAKTQTCPERFRLRGIVWVQVKIELSNGIVVAAPIYFHLFPPILETRLTLCEILDLYAVMGSAYI